MRFVIDETSWVLDGVDETQCTERLEEMLDRVDDALAEGHGCCYSDDLFNMPIRDGKSFYELYDEGSPVTVPQEVRVRIAAAFSRLPMWQDLDAPWPDSFEVSMEGRVPEFAPSVAWAQRQVRRDRATSVACISHPGRRTSGRVAVRVVDESAPVWFVATARDCEGFFRWLIAETTSNPEEMEALLPFAFKGLDFVQGACNGIKNMSKPYRTVVPAIVRHLSALSDEGARIFSGPRERVAAEFGPLGVDISDENGDTKSNRMAIAEHTRVVNGESRVFWWHTKLERHQDRIHVCPAKVTKNGGLILVGIFCRHLTV